MTAATQADTAPVRPHSVSAAATPAAEPTNRPNTVPRTAFSSRCRCRTGARALWTVGGMVVLLRTDCRTITYHYRRGRPPRATKKAAAREAARRTLIFMQLTP